MEEGYLDDVVWGNQGYVDLRLKDFGAIRDFTECEYSDPVRQAKLVISDKVKVLVWEI